MLCYSAGVNGIEAAYFLYDALRKVEEKWNSEEERSACPQYNNFKHPINFNLVKSLFSVQLQRLCTVFLITKLVGCNPRR